MPVTNNQPDVENILTVEVQKALVDVKAFPSWLNINYCKLDLLRKLAEALQLSELAHRISATLEEIFPPDTPIMVIDGAYRSFTGTVTGKVNAYGNVPVRLDIFGKDTDVFLGVEVLQARPQ